MRCVTQIIAGAEGRIYCYSNIIDILDWSSVIIRVLIFLTVVLSRFAVAAAQLPLQLTPEQEDVALRLAETKGREIFVHDRAAALATDALLALRTFKKDKRVNGWITEAQGEKIAVTFIDNSPAALYRVVISESAKIKGGVKAYKAPIPLTEFELGAVTARNLAILSPFNRCSENYNSVVLPEDQESGAKKWSVYLIPGTKKKHIIPIGGAFLVHTDGTTVASSRGFTKTCITLESDARAVAVFITHLLDQTPTEVHVFWNLWAKKPIAVGTPLNRDGKVWMIENGKIALIDGDKQEK